MIHESVLLQEVAAFLRPVRADGILVDATIGLGGHAEALLETYSGVRLLGIDRDPEALRRSAERLSRFENRVTLIRGRHELLIDILKQQRIETVSGVLGDLGVSSMQLDDASRGFSFRFDAPLDMRMSGEGQSAADLVNALDASELARILREYGEEPMARRIAQAIVDARQAEPVNTTARLASIVRSVKRSRPHDIDPATLTFQALRIATNEELTGLETFVRSAASVLDAEGRVAVISFHSLEDRIVKRTLRSLQGECLCPPGLPVCGCGATAVVNVLTGRPVIASDEEVRRNPRARSAKLRVAEKL